MSDLFTDMHRRRHNHLLDSCSNSSFNASAYSDLHPSTELAADALEYDANEAEDEISNILSLKLKKPKHWKWELSTSRSCKNIALPRILLYDHNGQLLVDANSQEEQVYKTAESTPPTNAKQKRKHSNRAATTNLEQSIRQALQQEFNRLQIQEATPSLQSSATSAQQTRNTSPLASSSCIDFFTNDLPDYKIERRSSSLKGVRFKDDDTKSSKSGNSFQINGLPTPPPSSGTTPTTGNSSSSGPREKRRYRRSHSSGRSGPINSPSILERFSFTRGRFSSPEYAEETEVYRPPRYFLRTSKAGTLVVQEESFSRCRRRPPRPKNSSSENIRYDNSPRSLSASSLKMPQNARDPNQFLAVQHSPSLQAGSLQNVAEMRRKKKIMPIRRFRSDGNVLLQANFSSSDEDEGVPLSCHQRPRHRYDHLKRHLKGEIVTIDPDNGVYHPFGSPTER